MPNSLGFYNPIFYAQEALIQLEKALGMAGRIHRGYDNERRSFGKGNTINIRKPSSFLAQDAPSVAQDLNPEGLSLTLDNWREVKFALTDKDLAFTGEEMIQEHIRPAAYALADDIDRKLTTLYKKVPWFYDVGSSVGISDITGPYQVLFDNKVPMDQEMLHYMVNGKLQNSLQGLGIFSDISKGGGRAEQTLMRGELGSGFGFNIFANQNVQSHTSGVSADSVGALSAKASKGASTIAISDVTDAGTFKAGDTLSIDDDPQRYVITKDATAVSGAATLDIFPVLSQNASSGTIVSINLKDSVYENLAFHRNFAALATAPLSEMGNELGAKIATVTDPKTRLSIRSRVYYIGDSSAVHVALDILYGYTILNPNLAVRCRQSIS